MDYPGVGPEHAWLKDLGRAEYIVATDEEALRGFRLLTQREGIIPGESLFVFPWISSLIHVVSALESSHAIWQAVQIAKTMSKEQDIVVVCSMSPFSIIRHKLKILSSVYLEEETRMLSRYPSYFQNGPTSLTGMLPLILLHKLDFSI